MSGWPVDERPAPTRSAFDAPTCSASGAGPPVKLPSSRTTLPGAVAGTGSCANVPPTETGASGSFASRRSSNTDCAFAPSVFRSASRSIDRRTSSPPPAPKRAPISVVTATTSLRVQGGTGLCVDLYWASIPATYASMSRTNARPSFVFWSSAICCPRNASVCRLGTNCLPDNATASGLSPGTSTAERRAGPRISSSRSPRSSAVAQPAPNSTSCCVLPSTCGTPKRSRRIVTPGLGLYVRTAFSRPRPSVSGLYHLVRSVDVTLSKSGVSPS